MKTLKIAIFALAVTCPLTWAASADTQPFSAAEIAAALNWIPQPITSTNLCGGYYQDPKALLDHPDPAGIKTAPITITASNQVYLSQTDAATLHGKVKISQPGRMLTANKATLHRDIKTGQLSYGDLSGNIQYRERGKLLISEYGRIDLNTNVSRLENALYRINAPKTTNAFSAWGKSKRAIRGADGELKLRGATYTTCLPNCNTWHIASSHLKLNKATGQGSSVNTRLYVKNVPVFYLPYLSFPIDKRRKSGFLYPSLSIDRTSGTIVDLPYYFNLAPNYDFVLTPQLISHRGIFFNSDLRYLTKSSHGKLTLGYINHDRLFRKFRDTAAQQYTSNTDIPALRRLERQHNDRGSISLQNNTQFNSNWSNNLYLNYVTDDYFLNDFVDIATNINNSDQLLNRFDINYVGQHWRLLTRLQAFQTLHRVDQTRAQEQYRRLPQFDLHAEYPNQMTGLSYQLNTQFVHFDKRRDFLTGQAPVTGDRIHVTPNVSLPIVHSAYFITPRLQLNITDYELKNPTNNYPTQIMRTLPMFNVDSGLILERNINLFNKQMKQTLEPRLFYLLVPSHNQTEIPNFDSTLPPFDINQLFLTNRFSGYDRVGDANQLAIAVASRFLDAETGEQKLNASVGQIYQLHTHSICLTSSCANDPLVNNRLSPIVAQLGYDITKYWSTSANMAWDTAKHTTNNAAVKFTYRNGSNHIFNIGYNFLRDGDSIIGMTKDLSRIDASLIWPIKYNWHILGEWNYNISHNRTQTYLYGLEYDSCCWAFRAVTARTYSSLDQQQRAHYDNKYYIQFMLKGLGNIGTGGIDNMLKDRISGYKNTFTTGMPL